MHGTNSGHTGNRSKNSRYLQPLECCCLLFLLLFPAYLKAVFRGFWEGVPEILKGKKYEKKLQK